MLEMIGAMIFVTLIMNIKRISGSDELILNAGAIATGLYGMINMLGNMTGACFNPAVGICQTIFQSFFYANLTYDSLWIYILAPMVGGLLAGFFGIMNAKANKIFKDAG